MTLLFVSPIYHGFKVPSAQILTLIKSLFDDVLVGKDAVDSTDGVGRPVAITAILFVEKLLFKTTSYKITITMRPYCTQVISVVDCI